MPIVIKEIRVNTVVEKKIITHQEISEDVYKRQGAVMRPMPVGKLRP